MQHEEKEQRHYGIVCPDIDCVSHDFEGEDNIVAKGYYTTKYDKVRRYRCKDCGKSFNENACSALFGLRSKHDRMILITEMVLSGVSIGGIARRLTIPRSSVASWVDQVHGKLGNWIISNKP